MSTVLTPKPHGVDGTTIDRVPNVIRRFAERNVRPGAPAATSLQVTQVGDMWRAPGGKPMHFTATETFGITEPRFHWDATFPLGPLLGMHVHDRFDHERGQMSARIVGIPVMNRTDPSIALGAGMRYLAELPWVPQAMVANPAVEWRMLADDEVEASTQTVGGRASVRLRLDVNGDVCAVAVDSRPRAGDAPRPWHGLFQDYAWFGDVRIPRSGAVVWELPTGPFTYWKGNVTGVTLRG